MEVSGCARLTAGDRVVTQEIVHDFPPLYDEIVAAFPRIKMRQDVIFSWGNRIYVPFTHQPISPALIAHEAVHGLRQGTADARITDWWRRYIDSPSFRLAEELAAHRAELGWWLEHGNRSERRAARQLVSSRLAGPLYGVLVTPSEALRLIEREPEDERVCYG